MTLSKQIKPVAEVTQERSSYPAGIDVCWLTRVSPDEDVPFESMLRENFRSLVLHNRVPEEGISANVVVFDLDSFSVRQLFKFRRQYDGGLIGVYKDEPPAETVRLLEHGIDECVKASDDRLLLARIRSLLSRAYLISDKLKIAVKGWRFDKQTMMIIPPDGNRLKLSTGQSKLLGLLMEREGKSVTREVISETIYGEPWTYGNRKIDMAIGALRRKLLDAGVDAKINTVSNSGYLLDLSPSS